jgi:hypothetical protein
VQGTQLQGKFLSSTGHFGKTFRAAGTQQEEHFLSSSGTIFKTFRAAGTQQEHFLSSSGTFGQKSFWKTVGGSILVVNRTFSARIVSGKQQEDQFLPSSGTFWPDVYLEKSWVQNFMPSSI